MATWGFKTAWELEATGSDKPHTKIHSMFPMLITIYQKLRKSKKCKRVFPFPINFVRNSNSETNYSNEYTEKSSQICPSKNFIQKQNSEMSRSKQLYQENSDFKSMSPDFKSFATSKIFFTWNDHSPPLSFPLFLSKIITIAETI